MFYFVLLHCFLEQCRYFIIIAKFSKKCKYINGKNSKLKEVSWRIEIKPTFQNVGLNVGLNKTEKAVLALLIGNPTLTAESISEQIGVTKRTIERALSELQRKGKIERLGSRRDGSWKVVG